MHSSLKRAHCVMCAFAQDVAVAFWRVGGIAGRGPGRLVAMVRVGRMSAVRVGQDKPQLTHEWTLPVILSEIPAFVVRVQPEHRRLSDRRQDLSTLASMTQRKSAATRPHLHNTTNLRSHERPSQHFRLPCGPHGAVPNTAEYSQQSTHASVRQR